MNTSSKLLAGVVVVAVLGFFGYKYSEQTPAESVNNTTDTMPENTNTQANDTPGINADVNLNTGVADVNTAATVTYKDGTYSTVAEYLSPGGPDKMGVSLTVKNNTVTAVTVTNQAGDSTSKNYQNKFISGINAAVVGKSFADLKVGVVSGASLASGAFNKSLVTLRAQAQN